MRKALAWAAAGTTIAVGLLSVAATANAATFAHPPKTPTTLSVHESAPGFRGHGKVTITGALSEHHKAVAGQAVTLDIVKGRHLVPAGAAHTNRGGAVAFTVSPKATEQPLSLQNPCCRQPDRSSGHGPRMHHGCDWASDRP